MLENEIETIVPPLAPRKTKFLTLYKCLPRHQFLDAGPCSFLVVRKLNLLSSFPYWSSTSSQRKKGSQARNPRQSCFLTIPNGSLSRALSSRTSQANANRLPTQTRTLRAQQSRTSGTGRKSTCCRNLVLSSASMCASGWRKVSMARTNKRTRLWLCLR